MTQERLFDLSGISVYIAIPCYSGIVPIETAIALAQTSVQLQNAGVDVTIGSERECGIITQVRNKLVWRFLNDSKADYLFWIDDDIIFSPSDFLTILALATIKKVAAATYPTRTETPVFFMQYLNGETPEFDEYGLIKTKGVGLGFACIERSVIESFALEKETYIEKGNLEVHNVFRLGIREDRQPSGEDLNFFNDLYDRGYITYVNPTITLKHVGRKDYSAQLIIKEK